jgi:hypothetical protein
MILMMEFTYPTAKSEEIGQAFVDMLQANPLPDYVKIVEIYFLWGDEGIKGYAFYDLENEKVYEGSRYVSNMTYELSKRIDGYKALAQFVTPMAEAYEMIGMKGP